MRPDISEGIKKDSALNKRGPYFTGLSRLTIIVMLLYSAYALFSFSDFPLEKVLLTLGIVWIAALAMVIYLLDRQRPPMPFLALIDAYYVFAFALPVFVHGKVRHAQFSIEDISIVSLLLVFTGLAVMNLVFYFSKRFIWSSVSPVKLKGPFSVAWVSKVLWAILAVHLLFAYNRSLRDIPTFVIIFDQIGYIVFGIFYILWARGKLSPLQSIILISAALPLEMTFRLASGAVYQIVLFTIFMALVIWYEKKRIPKFFIILMAAAAFLFNSVKGEYRSVIKYGSSNPIVNARLFAELLISRLSAGESVETETEDVLVQAMTRVAHINLFSEVIRDTPASVPYLNGVTYLPLFSKFIPRVIWPDKPQEGAANIFGREYGYLNANDYTTSLNLPIIIEFYINFGIAGVFAGMLLLGCFLAFLEQKLNSVSMDAISFVIGVSILSGLIWQESNFSLILGNTLSFSIFLALLFKLVLKSNPDSQNVI